jgi:hypothetical protein
MTSVEGRTAPKKKALRELVRKEQVIRTGKGGKKDPFKYSGFVVPNIYREPGNQNQINDVTPENNEINTGSHVWEGNSKEVISREPEKQGKSLP